MASIHTSVHHTATCCIGGECIENGSHDGDCCAYPGTYSCSNSATAVRIKAGCTGCPGCDSYRCVSPRKLWYVVRALGC